MCDVHPFHCQLALRRSIDEDGQLYYPVLYLICVVFCLAMYWTACSADPGYVPITPVSKLSSKVLTAAFCLVAVTVPVIVCDRALLYFVYMVCMYMYTDLAGLFSLGSNVWRLWNRRVWRYIIGKFTNAEQWRQIAEMWLLRHCGKTLLGYFWVCVKVRTSNQTSVFRKFVQILNALNES